MSVACGTCSDTRVWNVWCDSSSTILESVSYNAVTFFTSNRKKMPKIWEFLCRLCNLWGVLAIPDSPTVFILHKNEPQVTHAQWPWIGKFSLRTSGGSLRFTEVRFRSILISILHEIHVCYFNFSIRLLTYLIKKRGSMKPSRCSGSEATSSAPLCLALLCISNTRIILKIASGKTFEHCALNYTNRTVLHFILYTVFGSQESNVRFDV
jgi:hypothetical protein